MYRVFIFGPPGSGKTTLAHILGERLGMAIYELDLIAYVNGYDERTSADERQAELRRIIAQPAWVAEGAYIAWVGILLQSADTIVWLDFPEWITGWRILTRHIRKSLERCNQHAGLGKLLRFYYSCHAYYQKRTQQLNDDDVYRNRQTIEQLLRPYAHKVHRLYRPSDVVQFMARSVLSIDA